MLLQPARRGGAAFVVSFHHGRSSLTLRTNREDEHIGSGRRWNAANGAAPGASARRETRV
ncbi:hypothetical protein A8B73_00565 [Methylosinus sp. 3S-1]|nr:hypothetical protein A8B73_00565 [Methylosinus sp. 3S-1]